MGNKNHKKHFQTGNAASNLKLNKVYKGYRISSYL